MLRIYNEDCIEGMRDRFSDNSVDLIVTDPPYGIEGHKLDKHYNRDESTVVPGYEEVSLEEYYDFSEEWISECARILKKSGSAYFISGYTNLSDVLNAIKKTNLITVNHLIWKFSFPVYTTKKYVSTHYHILYCVKPPEKNKTFNTFCRFNGTKESYHDRMDVFEIKRKYKPGQIKNKNQLPESLVEKLIDYSSNEGDIVFDPFLGGFTTAVVAQRMERIPAGFELNEHAFIEFAGQLM